jgi:hypothetical protein
MTNRSSSSCNNCENISSTALESERSAITATCRLRTINSIGITTSCPYTKLKGVYPVKFLLVVLYVPNNVWILKSQSSLPILQIFVSAFSKILLKDFNIPFSLGWYGVLL